MDSTKQVVQSNMVAELGCIKKMLIKEDDIERSENILKVVKGPDGELPQVDSSGPDADGRRDQQRVLRDRMEPRKEDNLADSRRGRRGSRSSHHSSRNSHQRRMSISCVRMQQTLCVSAAQEQKRPTAMHRRVCMPERHDTEEPVDSRGVKAAKRRAARRVSPMGLRCAVDAQSHPRRRDVGRE